MVDDEAQRPWWHGHRKEKRDLDRRQQEFERRQQEQQERESVLKQRHGAVLAKGIDRAAEIIGVQDGQVKAIAVDLIVENLAERFVQPGQLSGSDLHALCYQTLARAEEVQRARDEELKRREQQQRDLVRDQAAHHYFAPVKETHRKVADMPTERDVIDDRTDREMGPQRRYAPLEETHREVAEASKPLDRSAREARDAEAQVTAGEMSDAKQARAAKLRTIAENFVRENQNEHRRDQGIELDRGPLD